MTQGVYLTSEEAVNAMKAAATFQSSSAKLVDVLNDPSIISFFRSNEDATRLYVFHI